MLADWPISWICAFRLSTQPAFYGVSFPPIPIAEIDGEEEWVLAYNRRELIQLRRKDEPND
jgi:hypothetical protein